MEFFEINKKLTIALNNVIKNDKYLLDKDIHERTICQRLGVYLEPLFPDFNVDCEYNGDIDEIKGKKIYHLLREKLNQYKEDEMIREFDYRIYPDIIVHKRGCNDKNLLIIEVKKFHNLKKGNWDIEKIKMFTSNDYGNHFNYQYGVFISFTIGENPNFEIHWYQNGQDLKQHE